MTRRHARPVTRSRTLACALIALAAASAAGCATTSTKRIRLDPAEVAAEEARQRQLVLADAIVQQQRIVDIAFPILRASTSLCREDVAPRSGFLVSNAWEYDAEWRPAAVQVLGLDDVLQVTAVARGSAAERAGLRPGDRLLAPADPGGGGVWYVGVEVPTER